MKYPVRCRIVDAAGVEMAPGVFARTPDISMEHIGKEGTAEEVGRRVRITLDDGNILYGEECWWKAIGTVE